MDCGHEKLGVYPAFIEYISWAFRLCGKMKNHCKAKGLYSDTDSDADSDSAPRI